MRGVAKLIGSQPYLDSNNTLKAEFGIWNLVFSTVSSGDVEAVSYLSIDTAFPASPQLGHCSGILPHCIDILGKRNEL